MKPSTGATARQSEMTDRIMMSVRDRLALSLVRLSWRLARHTSFHVRLATETGVLLVPIHLGAGLDNLNDTESWLRPVIRHVFGDRRGLFLDVGANIGQALISLLRVSRDIPYLGLEPNHDSCDYLNRLIRANRLECHHALPVGLGASASVASLRLGSDFDVSATLVSGFRPDTMFPDARSVLVERGDALLARLDTGPVQLVKIDVEGAGLETLQGLQGMLDRDRPTVVIEVLGYRHLLEDPTVFGDVPGREVEEIVALRRSRIEMLESFVRQHRFDAALIGPDGGWHRVDTLDPPSDRVENNFLLTPSDPHLQAP